MSVGGCKLPIPQRWAGSTPNTLITATTLNRPSHPGDTVFTPGYTMSDWHNDDTLSRAVVSPILLKCECVYL